ncbi:head-tail connector protein [Actinomadura sp. NPDC049753]|uniref:head-tail connector protein n=1 Tax=Actinomadura sp. NPDC049753 TaxID=3154739 RepID=UPI003434888C
MAATDIIDLAAAKEQLNIDPDNTDSDAELALYVSAATEVVERYVGAVIQRPVTERFDGGRSALLLSALPVASVTSVTVGGSVLDAAGVAVSESGVLTRVSGSARMNFSSGTQTVEVVYVAGRAASVAEVPARYQLAARIIVQHMWETQRPAAQGPFSQASDDYDPRYAYSVPRRAQELLGVEIGEWAGFA